MPRGLSSPSIRRRPGLALGAFAAIVALLVLAAGAFEGGAPAQTTQAKPNVVLVMTDDQTVEQMGALRRVNRLIGRAGTTFTHNFSTFPLCCPSRATYLTGQYSHTTTSAPTPRPRAASTSSTRPTPCPCGSATPAMRPRTSAST